MLIDVTVPQLGESVTEGTITKWLVKEGDIVKKDQALAEIATDKADSELPSPAGGRVAKLLAKEGDVVPVKTVIVQLEEGVTGPANAPAPAAAAPAAPAVAPAAGGSHGPLAPPAARRTALEQGVDLGSVKGSGERGRDAQAERQLQHGEDAPYTKPCAVHVPSRRVEA